MNMATMAENVSMSTKHKFLVLDPMKWVEAFFFCLFNLTRIPSDNGSVGGYMMELSSIWPLRNVFPDVLF